MDCAGMLRRWDGKSTLMGGSLVSHSLEAVLRIGGYGRFGSLVIEMDAHELAECADELVEQRSRRRDERQWRERRIGVAPGSEGRLC